MSSRADRRARGAKNISGFRLRPELIEALPLIAWLAPVAEAMERVVFTVEPDLDILELLQILVRRGAHAVPVVDGTGALVGLVSKADLLSALWGEPDPDASPEMASSGFAAASGSARGNGRHVRDIMTPCTEVVDEGMSLGRAAALIAQGIHPVPVVNDEGRVTGLLSSIDVLRWLVRNDGPLKI